MPELSPETQDAIHDAIFAGRKIDAIKIYRKATGTDLLEAKKFIEALQRRLHEEYPNKFQPPSKAGCSGVLFVAIVLSTLAILMR